MNNINNALPEIRCPRCNKLLAKGVLDVGIIEFQCPGGKCNKRKIILRATRPSLAPHDGLHGDSHVRKNPSQS